MKYLKLISIIVASAMLSACGGGSSSSDVQDTAIYTITASGVQCPRADTFELGDTGITCYWECAIYKGVKGAIILSFIRRSKGQWVLDEETVTADPECKPYSP